MITYSSFQLHILNAQAFYQQCLDKRSDFELCLRRAEHMNNAAPNCQLLDKAAQLIDRYENSLSMAMVSGWIPCSGIRTYVFHLILMHFDCHWLFRNFH